MRSVLASGLIAAAAASALANPAHTHPHTAVQPVIRCPVTGDKIATPKSAFNKETYQGKTYYFCCPECKPQFDKNSKGIISNAAKGKYEKDVVATGGCCDGTNISKETKMIKTFATAGAVIALASAVLAGANAHAGHKAAKAAGTYHCAKCHMKFTASKAKADHYKDPMDGGKLVPDSMATPKSGSMKMKSGSMGGMKM